MRILFMCGCLEPGRDGVGDYTRSLAAELIKQGHQSTAVALHDVHLSENLIDNQEIYGIILTVLRISVRCSTKERSTYALKWIQEFNPDWVSLQYVPFSFHPKGLPLWLNSKLKSLTHGFKLHIMFHELWVGVNSKESLKMRLLGVTQKILIKEMLNNVKPSCITTTLPIYKKYLADSKVNVLPLFGNIPFINSKEYLRNDNCSLKVVHFGSFTGLLGEFESQLQFLIKVAMFYNKEVELIAFGEGGPYKDKALEIARNIFGKDRVTVLGRLSAQDISLLLQTADIGISRADIVMSGKSGSTLAMLEHGLSVLLRGKQSNINNEAFKDLSYNEQLLFCDSDYSRLPQKRSAKSNLIEIAQKFVNLLIQNRKSSLKAVKEIV
jgi:hypothetical protein